MLTSAIHLARLRARIRVLGVAFAAVIAIALPVGFASLEVQQHHTIARILATQAAERIAAFAEPGGANLAFGATYLRSLVDPYMPQDTKVRIDVRNVVGDTLLEIGPVLRHASVDSALPIIAHGERIGTVEVTVEHELSFALVWWMLGGIALGALAYGLLELLPMRALRRGLGAVEDAQGRLIAQIAATDAAYEDLQRNHREAEETADALSRAVRQAEIANRTKTEFLANISHELRTPLNAIIGFSEILKDEMRGPSHPSYKGYAKDIHDSGTLLLAVINDILDLSKIEAGRQELNLEIVPPMQIVRSCATLVRERALAAGVKLAIAGGDGLEDISADPIKLKQVLLNLLSNAIKFTPRDGTVTVGVLRQSSAVTDFVVADTGIGMKREDIPIALEPFRQIDSTLARRYEGTGLGLPLARALTELHGGQLEIESEQNRGTTVTVSVPRGISAAAARAA